MDGGDNHQVLFVAVLTLGFTLIILGIGLKIMVTVADVQAKYDALKAVADKAIGLLNDLKSRLDQAIASNDPAALQALSDSMGTETDALNAAVAADTPADGAGATGATGG